MTSLPAPATAVEVIALIFSRQHLDESKCQALGEEVTNALWAELGSAGTSTFGIQVLNPGRVIQVSVGGQDGCQVMARCTQASQADALTEIEAKHNVEVVIQPAELYHHHLQPGLAVFDMDSTLIQQEVIDELARAVGLYDRVAAITEAAMRGEAPYIDFEASLRARVALLKGVPTSIWDKLKTETIKFTPGAADLVKCLNATGWKTAVLSGGFTPLANWVKETLGLDYAFANHLVANNEEGILTGELVPGKPIIHGEKKRELLVQLASDNAIPIARTIAVGDGSNDLPMMHTAGLGIAFNAKPKVQRAAPTRLNSSSLLDVMYILGYSKEQIDELLSKSRREKAV